MPYIKEERRDQVPPCQSAGELNYAITMLIQSFIRTRMHMVDKPLKYCMVNDVLGALEGAKLEFYRRVVAEYEDIKVMQNGDVYLPALFRGEIIP